MNSESMNTVTQAGRSSSDNTGGFWSAKSLREILKCCQITEEESTVLSQFAETHTKITENEARHIFPDSHYGITSHERYFFQAEELLRFIRARDLSIPKAFQMYSTYREWRERFMPHIIDPVESVMNNGAIRFMGTAYDNHPVLWSHTKLARPWLYNSIEDPINNTIFICETIKQRAVLQSSEVFTRGGTTGGSIGGGGRDGDNGFGSGVGDNGIGMFTTISPDEIRKDGLHSMAENDLPQGLMEEADAAEDDPPESLMEDPPQGLMEEQYGLVEALLEWQKMLSFPRKRNSRETMLDSNSRENLKLLGGTSSASSSNAGEAKKERNDSATHATGANDGTAKADNMAKVTDSMDQGNARDNSDDRRGKTLEVNEARARALSSSYHPYSADFYGTSSNTSNEYASDNINLMKDILHRGSFYGGSSSSSPKKGVRTSSANQHRNASNSNPFSRKLWEAQHSMSLDATKSSKDKVTSGAAQRMQRRGSQTRTSSGGSIAAGDAFKPQASGEASESRASMAMGKSSALPAAKNHPSSFVKLKPPRIYVLMDLSGWSLKHASYRKFQNAVLQTLMDYYPELALKIFIVNPPRLFDAAWMVFKNIIPAKTKAKIQWIGNISRDPISAVAISELKKANLQYMPGPEKLSPVNNKEGEDTSRNVVSAKLGKQIDYSNTVNIATGKAIGDSSDGSDRALPKFKETHSESESHGSNPNLDPGIHREKLLAKLTEDFLLTADQAMLLRYIPYEILPEEYGGPVPGELIPVPNLQCARNWPMARAIDKDGRISDPSENPQIVEVRQAQIAALIKKASANEDHNQKILNIFKSLKAEDPAIDNKDAVFNPDGRLNQDSKGTPDAGNSSANNVTSAEEYSLKNARSMSPNPSKLTLTIADATRSPKSALRGDDTSFRPDSDGEGMKRGTQDSKTEAENNGRSQDTTKSRAADHFSDRDLEVLSEFTDVDDVGIETKVGDPLGAPELILEAAGRPSHILGANGRRRSHGALISLMKKALQSGTSVEQFKERNGSLVSLDPDASLGKLGLFGGVGNRKEGPAGIVDVFVGTNPKNKRRVSIDLDQRVDEPSTRSGIDSFYDSAETPDEYSRRFNVERQ